MPNETEIHKIIKTLDYSPSEMLTTALDLIMLCYLQICPADSKEELMDFIMKSFSKSMLEFNAKLEDLNVVKRKHNGNL